MTIGNNEYQFNQTCISGIYKDWQLNITSDLRGDLVESIVKALVPNNNLTILNDRRRDSLLLFATKIERDCYLNSDSKEEYFHLISKKIKFIRREFEERKLLRKIDNLNNLTNSSSVQRSILNNNQPNNQSNNNQLNNLSTSIWIQTLSAEQRQVIVKKILQVVYPMQGRAIYDVRFLNLIKYAQKIERDCYLRAQTKENYYQLIAEKVHRILIELNLKRARREGRLQKELYEADLTSNKIVRNQLDMRNRQFERSTNQLEMKNQLPMMIP